MPYEQQVWNPLIFTPLPTSNRTAHDPHGSYGYSHPSAYPAQGQYTQPAAGSWFSAPNNQPFHRSSTYGAHSQPGFYSSSTRKYISMPVKPKALGFVTPKSSRTEAITYIPAEIWGVIFSFCLPSSIEGFRPSKKKAPLLLTHISRGLRHIAFGNSALWSSLYLVLDHEHHQFPGPALIRLWLQASGTRGLTFIFSPFDINEERFEDATPIAHELIKVLPRWKSATIWHRYIDTNLVYRMQSNAMMLKSLTLEGPTDLKYIDPHISHLWDNSPRFSSFTLQHKGPADKCRTGFPQVFQLPFHQLTELKLTNTIALSDLMFFLPYCLNLQDCTLENLTIRDGTGSLSNRIHLPSLRMLDMSVDLDHFVARCMMPVLSSVLKNIYAPNLRALSLGYEECWTHRALEDFLRQSQCRLESLAFKIVSISESELIQTLHAMSSFPEFRSFILETGEEAHSPMSREVLRLLTPGHHYLCSNLQYISCNSKTVGNGSAEFVNMITQRCYLPPHARTLQQVGLTVDRKNRKVKKDLRQLENLSKVGLKVVIKNQD